MYDCVVAYNIHVHVQEDRQSCVTEETQVAELKHDLSAETEITTEYSPVQYIFVYHMYILTHHDSRYRHICSYMYIYLFVFIMHIL